MNTLRVIDHHRREEAAVEPDRPVLTEDRVVQHNLLQKLNQLVGEVSGHEGLDSDGHFLWILGL